MTFIVQSYFDTLLRYVLSVTFCGAVVSVKVMDQNFKESGWGLYVLVSGICHGFQNATRIPSIN